jgi:hypothetical protein
MKRDNETIPKHSFGFCNPKLIDGAQSTCFRLNSPLGFPKKKNDINVIIVTSGDNIKMNT